MSNDLRIKLPSDRSKIDVNEPGEIIWWAYHLGVGLEKLLSIVRKVGNLSYNVRKEIDESNSN